MQRRDSSADNQVQDSTAEIQATMAKAQALSYGKLSQQVQQARLINDIVRSLRSTLVPDEISQTTVLRLQQSLNVSRCLIFRHSPKNQIVVSHIQRNGCAATEEKQCPLGDGRDLYLDYHTLLAQGQSVVIPRISPSLTPEIQDSARVCGMSSVLIVPLLYQQTYLGGISLEDRDREWTIDEITFVEEIASHCAVAIHQAELYQQAQTEITQRQLREDILLQNTFELQTLFQAFPDIYFRLDGDGTILNYYAGQDTDLYVPPEEFLGKRLRDVLPPDVGHQLQSALLQVLKTNSLVAVEYSLTLPSGEKSFEARLLPPLENQIITIVRNVTERKQAEAAQRESEDRFRRLYEATFEGIVIHADGKIIDANKALAQMCGYELSEAIGMNTLDLLAVESRDLAWSHISSEDESPYEADALRKDGITFPVEIQAKTINYHGHRVRVTAARDITRRKQAEAALQKAKEELEVKVNERTFELRNALEQLQKEIGDRVKAETLLAGQNRVLQSIATGADLTSVLDFLARFIEEQSSDDGLCSILLLDKNGINLRHGAAPSLPDSYTQAIDGAAIDFNIGPCGSAVYCKQLVIVSDIPTDFQWEPKREREREVEGVLPFRDLALLHGLQACCSNPIFAPNGDVLGSVALYYRTPHSPSINDRKLIDICSQLAGIAISRQRAESAIHESKKRFRNLVETTSDWVWEIDETGVYTYVSPKVRDLLGYSPEEVLGKTPFDFMLTEEASVFAKIFASIAADKKPFSSLENRNIHKDGREVILETSGVPFFDSNGKFLGYRGIDRDITSRKRVELEMRQSLEKEKELNELKSRFVTMASHEFRTPLSTILSSTELLQHYSSKWPDEKKNTHYRRISICVNHMTHLLNDVLIIGKAEAGKIEVNPAPLNLEDFCHELVLDMQLSAGSKHFINFVNSGECKAAYMDEKLLRHIFSNLLSNAIKYSPGGGTVDFKLSCEDGKAIFQVRDFGIGIPPEDQLHLFASFHRALNVGTIPGTGLGLAIVKKCVELHGGDIIVASEVGRGTTFTVTIPVNYQPEML